MAMYATKVWGFASAEWPIITFSREGVRNRLASLWQPGDTMLLIGTQQEPTEIQDQGKILGYVEFTSIPVLTRKVVTPAVLAKYGDKWPYALLCTESWALESSPMFKTFFPELAARYPGMSMASNFAKLSSEEEARIRQLPTLHEIFPRNDAAQYAVDQTNLTASLRNGGRGPVTYTGTYTITRSSSPAQTYLLQQTAQDSAKAQNLMKIGWAYSAVRRAEYLSQPLVPEFTGIRWKVLQKQSWPHEYAARFMEQTILDLLTQREIVTCGEYFKPPLKQSVITSELWYDALLLTNKHIEAISDEELKANIDFILAETTDN